MEMVKAFKLGTIINDFKTLSMLQLTFLVGMLVTMSGLSIYWQDTYWVSILAGLTGVICVFMVNMRKLSNFAWGFVNCALYGYMAYEANFFGDTMLNWGFYLPVQLIGAYYWAQSMEGSEVVSKKVSFLGVVMMSALAMALIALYGSFLGSIGGSLSNLDATTTVLSILATFLMVKGYREQWLCWIVVNIISIFMWYTTSSESGAGVGVLIMWVMFLVNSLYGTYTWFKASK